MLLRVTSIGTGYILPPSYSCRLQPRVQRAKECTYGTRYRHGESIAVHVRSACRRSAYALPACIVIYCPVLPRVSVTSPRRGSSSAVAVARDSATPTPNQCTYQLWKGPALGPGSGSSRGSWSCPLPTRFLSVIPCASG